MFSVSASRCVFRVFSVRGYTISIASHSRANTDRSFFKYLRGIQTKGIGAIRSNPGVHFADDGGLSSDNDDSDEIDFVTPRICPTDTAIWGSQGHPEEIRMQILGVDRVLVIISISCVTRAPVVCG